MVKVAEADIADAEYTPAGGDMVQAYDGEYGIVVEHDSGFIVAYLGGGWDPADEVRLVRVPTGRRLIIEQE